MKSVEIMVSLSNQHFVGVRTIRVRRVEEGDAAVHGVADELHHLSFLFGRAVEGRHAHAAQPQSGHLQALRAQLHARHGGQGERHG